jgi:hypothetical protein
MKLDDGFLKLREIAGNKKVGVNRLLEMTKLSKDETGLPVYIWVDEGKTFSRQSRRIKFQDTPDPDSGTWHTMTVEESPRVIVRKGKTINLSKSDLDLVKKFVIMNLPILEILGNPECEIVEFTKKMKKVTDPIGHTYPS